MIEKFQHSLTSSLSNYFYIFCFSLILFSISPVGYLSGNEEMYYGLANKFINLDWNGEFSSFIASGDYRFISDSILGYMILFLGFENTQIIGSIIASLLFTHAITLLFNDLGIANKIGILVIVVFLLLGQSFIGREWLFEDFEAKIFAYYFVLLATRYFLVGDNIKLAVFLSLATYFHLLVGFSWFALFLASSLLFSRSYADNLKSFLIYKILSSPILFIAAYGFLGTNFEQDPSLPSPSYIYSYIRQYKMVLPFYSISHFLINWLPGILLHMGLFAGIILLKRKEDQKSDKLYSLLIVSSVILILLLVISLFDKEGVIAKFYPYRYTSLLLFLFITFYLSNINSTFTDQQENLSLISLVILCPFLLVNLATNTAYEYKEVYIQDNNKESLYEYIEANTKKNEIILIHPELEEKLFDFERELNRPTLVTFKYIPSSKEGLTEWYKRREFKAQIFQKKVNENTYPFSYKIYPNDDIDKSIEGQVIFKNPDYTLLEVPQKAS